MKQIRELENQLSWNDVDMLGVKHKLGLETDRHLDNADRAWTIECEVSDVVEQQVETGKP